jgi:hypothetical protein
MEKNNRLSGDSSRPIFNKYTMPLMAFTTLQITIFYTNRSQIMYLTTRQYGIFYITIFSCMYPFGFSCGSILNQYLILKFGRREAYIILFAVVSISLLANNIYHNKFSWCFFRFFYSFAMSGLIGIFDAGLEVVFNKSKHTLPKKLMDTSSVKAANFLSGLLLSAWRLEYFQVVTISAILLQISQIFFTITKELLQDIPFVKSRYMPRVFFDIYKKDKAAFLSFIWMNGIYGVYLTWIFIVTANLQDHIFVRRFLVLFFVMGEILSCYLFNNISHSNNIKINIALDTTLFSLINIFLFWLLHYNYHKLFLLLLLISGLLISKITVQNDILIRSYHNHLSKKEMDLTYLITKQGINIASSLLTIPFAMYKSQFVIIVILAVCIFNSILLTGKKN